jgi:hypothetical protein
MFDVPLLTIGLEHLYATLGPFPDLTERQSSARSSTTIS